MPRPALVSLLILPLCFVAVAAQLPQYPCFHTQRPPVIDGQIDGDPAWENLPRATGFSVLGDGYTIGKQTAFRACWDAEALYLGIVCEEPDVAQMKFSVSDGGDAWLDDGVELFLQPGADAYQLIVTARGARSCGLGAPDFTKIGAAASTGDAFYALEVRIPHTVVGACPAIGDTWRGNICRNIFTRQSGGDRFTSWAPLTKQFAEPEHFGLLIFEGDPPEAPVMDAMKQQVNEAYRKYLLGRIRDVAALGPQYADVIRQAVKDEQFARRARELRRGWHRLERLLRHAQDAPVTDLRQASLGAADLERGSYELKWRYLIQRVLEEN